MALSKADYAARVAPSMRCAARCGNMYTASLYVGLASLLASVEPAALKCNLVSLYAFGSGCSSIFFTLRFKVDTSFESSRRIDELLASPEVTRDLDD